MFLSNVYFNIVFIRLKPLTWNISITVSGERAGHVWTGPNINNTHRQQPASVTCAPSSSKGFAKKCVTRLCEWNATSCHIVSRRFRLSRLTRSTQHTCRPLRPQGGRSTPSCWSHVSDSPPTRRAERNHWIQTVNPREKRSGDACVCAARQAVRLLTWTWEPVILTRRYLDDWVHVSSRSSQHCVDVCCFAFCLFTVYMFMGHTRTLWPQQLGNPLLRYYNQCLRTFCPAAVIWGVQTAAPLFTFSINSCLLSLISWETLSLLSPALI